MGDAVALDDRAAIVDRIVREENRLQHLGRGHAIDSDARLDRFLQLNGLLDGDEGANPDVGQPFDRLDDDFDVLTLFVGGLKEGQVPQLREQAAQLGLKNDQHGDSEKRRERSKQPAQHGEFERTGHQRERQEHDQKASENREAASAPNEAQNIIDADREDEYLQRGSPNQLENLNHS